MTLDVERLAVAINDAQVQSSEMALGHDLRIPAARIAAAYDRMAASPGWNPGGRMEPQMIKEAGRYDGGPSLCPPETQSHPIGSRPDTCDWCNRFLAAGG